MTYDSFCDLPGDIVELAPYVPTELPICQAPLREIAFQANAWLPAETDRLREAFLADHSLDDIARDLGRSRAGIATRIADLGLRRHSRRDWLEWEDGELVRRYGEEPASDLAALLGRSVSAVYARAKLLDLSEPAVPAYTGWEDVQIKEGYRAGVQVAQIAQLIGRPFAGVIGRAAALNLRHACQPEGWSDEELARAFELAGQGHRYVVIVDRLADEGFPRRSARGFGQKLRKFGYGRGWGRAWIAEEDDLLTMAYATGASLTPLRERLGRSAHSIRWRVAELGLRGSHDRPNGFRSGPDWSDDDNAVLRRDYGKRPTRQIAASLGRGVRAVLMHANRLGLSHGYIRSFTPEEDRAIATAWEQGISLTDLAQALGRDAAVISKHAVRIGYRFTDPARPCKAPRCRRAGRIPVAPADLMAPGPWAAVPKKDEGRPAA